MLRMFVGEVSSGRGRKKMLDVCLPTKIVLDEPQEVVTVLFLHQNQQRNFPCQKAVTIVGYDQDQGAAMT